MSCNSADSFSDDSEGRLWWYFYHYKSEVRKIGVYLFIRAARTSRSKTVSKIMSGGEVLTENVMIWLFF